VYTHPWLDLYVDRVRFPKGRLVDHHVVYFKRESVATLVENAEGKILLIRSYRYITDSIEWELPAGGFEKGETVFEASRREVREETGYDTSGHRLLYTYNPVNGLSNKVFHVVHCRAGKIVGKFDGNEVKGVRWHTQKQVREMIRRNRIHDGFALASLLLYFFGVPAKEAKNS